MATKAIKTTIKIQIPARQANPAPPVGTALGPQGINIADFCKQFNEATKEEEAGLVFPALITIYEDRTFSFKLKTPPASVLLKKAAGIEKGSKEGAKSIVGRVKMSDITAIAEKKMVDLNAYDLEAAKRIIMGTAKNMGLEVIK